MDGGSEDGAGVVPDVAAENELLLRSQLMSMYYQVGVHCLYYSFCCAAYC